MENLSAVVMFASEDHETTYVSNITDVAQMLLKKHGENYLIVNLSDRRNDMHKMHRQVIDFGWPETLAPPLERLCNICKCIDSYLNGNQKNVVVIHCKGGLGRLAVVLSAYIDYSNICSSDIQNLDQFSMKNFYDNKLAGCTHPSQRRYVHYFAGLLSGGISINNNPLFLHQIVIRGVPNFDGKGGCCPYIKIYQGMKPVYVSGVLLVRAANLNQIIVTLDPCLQLRSDILVKCYNKSSNSSANREMIFRCQFHTCAVNNNNSLKFGKTDLDEACQDSRFPSHGQVEFVLSESVHNWNKYEISDTERNILIGNSPESIERWNSYENFAGPLEDITFESGHCFV
ncbi:hypothetical protein HELRODRAFT_62427 [Helobdella robusta]|uniref:Phosphatidylinositol-3,4,5-trisphosphate 3-phosphatase n=1 Tax=Helobdella robusta TaxID=6412 RepID=T1FX05_HELRO|nr:hypothetical protein HELRODRAFT_62427 [Helobdella robusta]ESO12353.1 hypothetical protein HELRODRAFT_62427 [Helobdella robusta]